MTSDGPVCANCGLVRESYKDGRLVCSVARAHRRRKYKHRGSKYGLTRKQVAALPGVCEVCQVEPADNIDHCHTSGRVRGHLCRSCNLGLGFFKDNTDILQSAVVYLERK